MGEKIKREDEREDERKMRGRMRGKVGEGGWKTEDAMTEDAKTKERQLIREFSALGKNSPSSGTLPVRGKTTS